jgi:hypothetical protein
MHKKNSHNPGALFHSLILSSIANVICESICETVSQVLYLALTEKAK